MRLPPVILCALGVGLVLAVMHVPEQQIVLLSSDADGPAAEDADKYEWYSAGSERDDGHRHMGFKGVITGAWPDVLRDPSTFPIARGGVMQLADVNAASNADPPRSSWYDAGATRDDQFTRIPIITRTIQSAYPQLYKDPGFEMPEGATVRRKVNSFHRQQQLASTNAPLPTQRLELSGQEPTSIRVFHGTGQTWDVEQGSSLGSPRQEENNWSLPAGQYNPAMHYGYRR